MSALADRLDPAQAARLQSVPEAESEPKSEVATALELVASMRKLVDGGVSDANVLAETMIGLWSDAECRVMLSALLPNYLRGLVESHAEAASIQEWRDRAAQPKATAPTPNRVTTPQRVSSWYTQTLASKVTVGASWKYLADCTADELMQASARLRTKAIRLARLADALRDVGVQTVSQLPEARVRAALDEGAE